MSRGRAIIIGVALFAAVLFDGWIRMLMDADVLLSNAKNAEACKELNTTLKERQVGEWQHSRKRM